MIEMWRDEEEFRVYTSVFDHGDPVGFLTRIRGMAKDPEAIIRARKNVEDSTLEDWLQDMDRAQLDTHTAVILSGKEAIVVNVGNFSSHDDSFVNWIDELVSRGYRIRLLATNLKHNMFIRRFCERWPQVYFVEGCPGLDVKLSSSFQDLNIKFIPIAKEVAPGIQSYFLSGDPHFNEVVLVDTRRNILVVADLFYGSSRSLDLSWPSSLRCFFAFTKTSTGLPSYRQEYIVDAEEHRQSLGIVFKQHPSLHTIVYAHGAGLESGLDVKSILLRHWSEVHPGQSNQD